MSEGWSGFVLGINLEGSTNAAVSSRPQAQVLDALVTGCCSREERATVLPEAFTPPGIEFIASNGRSGADSASQGGKTSVIRVCTSPKVRGPAIAVVHHFICYISSPAFVGAAGGDLCPAATSREAGRG